MQEIFFGLLLDRRAGAGSLALFDEIQSSARRDCCMKSQGKIMTSSRILRPLLLVAALTTAAAAQTPAYKVLVLDAADGKPQEGIKVGYLCEGKGWEPQDEIRTGPDGIAVIPYTCEGGPPAIMLRVPASADVVECGRADSLDWSEVVNTGVVAEPPTGQGDMTCSRAISRKLKPVPGQVTTFVKKLNWWQLHVWF